MAGYENEIKIIGGLYKGKILPVKSAEGLRPTPARVRETIFSWLGSNIENANVLDLFAGSGALGFESLSRGAKKVTLVEMNPQTADSLKSVAQSFNSDNIEVIKANAINYLENTSQKFDVIFIGDDWKGTDKWNKIETELKDVGAKVVYFPYTKGTSSTLINETLVNLRSK